MEDDVSQTHECEICKKTFKLPYYLKEHVDRMHRDDNTRLEYDWNICGKSFKCKGYLQIHQTKVHEKIKNEFQCDLCKKDLSSNSSLKEHLIRIHGDKKQYQCDVCGKRFPIKDDLKRHKKMSCKEQCFENLWKWKL